MALVDDPTNPGRLMSPGLAMAMQAGTNIGNIRMGQPVTTSPYQAYQQSVIEQNQIQNRRRLLEMRQQEMENLQNYRQQSLGVQAMKAAQPTALQQKLGGLMSLYGAATPEELFANPDARDPLINLLSGGGVNVNIGPEQEADAWEEARITRNIAQWEGLQDAATNAFGRQQRLGTMLRLNEGIEQGGTLGQGVQWFKENLEGLGIDLPGLNEDTTPQQLFSALATQNQFERTAMLKGAISEKELGLAGLMDSTMANTQEGRRFILNYRLAEAQRIQDMADAANAWSARTGEPYDERKFMQSDEYKALKEMPMVNAGMLEYAKEKQPDQWSEFVKNPEDGRWYRIVEVDGEEALVPVAGG